ncbi:BTB/POZ domain-containing protein At1g04390 isoform X1 [Nicotiana tomentosiformis]|uniref:BTB/POZ domain-containing protein At1g04390 isoform X1 n=2 Tax=Nicotiana tomentosiformis TaxID=4098 RepID=UPI00051B3DEB|nr:BTB/POZ domain-containing protein At1g04390 isoform X1 [Nicotiana tomentosiformis]
MRSSSSSKQAADNSRGISGHLLTLHQRLYHALNLGTRYCDDGVQKLHYSDNEMQRLVLRSVDAFLDNISAESLQHQVVKESVGGIVAAVGSILASKSAATLRLASDVAVKIVRVIPSTMLQLHLANLIHPLSSLLSFQELRVAISCASALNLILSNLSSKREKEVSDILRTTNVVGNLVQNVKGYSSDNKPTEYFQEMASLLSKILWRWPPPRFRVWTDTKLLNILDTVKLNPDCSIRIAVLQLYSALALCGNGTKKLLEDGEGLVKIMVDSLDSSNPYSVQIEGLRLAQCLTKSEQGCSKINKSSCEPFVKAVITLMSNWSFDAGKLAKCQMSILVEACRLALITRWAGDHQFYLWKAGVDGVLLSLLIGNSDTTQQSLHSLSLQEQIVKLEEVFDKYVLLPLRPYVWDILGWLAANCMEDFSPKMHGNETSFNALVICACLAFVDSILTARQISQGSVCHSSESEPASRAVLMMIYSPSKYIASETRFILSEVLSLKGKDYVEYLLDILKAVSSGNKFGIPSNFRLVITLITLACYSALPKIHKHVIQHGGIPTLLSFISWWLDNPVHLNRSSVAPHVQNYFSERTCCWPSSEDWEGEDMLLLFGLMALGELINAKNCGGLFCNQMESRAAFIRELQEICINNSNPGPRWYAAYILRHFGLYGFPSKFGREFRELLTDNEYTDVELIIKNQEPVHVHGVILLVRCPSLLPLEELFKEKKIGSSSEQDSDSCYRLITKVRLSAHVDCQSLTKLLEYIYSGFFEAGEDLVKKLKILARHCNLQPLVQLLYGRSPKWGTPFPSSDINSALGPAGRNFSDIILEAETSRPSNEDCNSCSISVLHLHVHKVVLWSSCEYLRALFQSGMQESHSLTIKVPVCWDSLVKLVSWFYSGELPRPISGCLWDNLDKEEKLHELQPYVELCSLAQFWLLEDLHDECFRLIVSILDSYHYLSIKITQMAANLNQWKLVEVAAEYLAPMYHHLRNSGELDVLDEHLIEIVRAASVQFSQRNGHLLSLT